MTRKEFFDYAEANKLVVWSEECSEYAFKLMDGIGKAIADINAIDSMKYGNGAGTASEVKIEVLKILKNHLGVEINE